MKHKLVTEHDGQRTHLLVFATGDEVMRELKQFAQTQHLSAAQLSGIGAFQKATLGYFDWDKKEYLRIPVDEQVELLSLNGNIALSGQDPLVHAHVVLGRRDGVALGGHLIEGHVRPTLEMFLTEMPAELLKKRDAQSGLTLMDLP